ncbi:MAG: hypothetical protein J6K31_03285 [Parabacteroides sp.]|nr:hypothetical protein [Parabacteroides sp.]
MNKKFSTLVASLLLTSAFSVYAGTAASMFAAPVAIETKAAAASNAVEVAALPAADKAVVGTLPSFTNNARLVVFKDANTASTGFVKQDGTVAAYPGPVTTEAVAPFYFTLDGTNLKDKNGDVLVLGNKQQFEIVPLVTTADNEVATPYFALKVVGAATDTYVAYDGSDITADATDVANAAIFASVQTEYNLKKAADELNAILNDGFEMTIAKAEGDKSTVSNVAAFSGKLKATAGTGSVADYYTLTKGENTVIFNKDAEIGSNQSALKGAFESVKSDNDKVTGSASIKYFQIKAADNGSDGVMLYVTDNTGTPVYSAYIASLANVNYLTAGEGATLVNVTTYPYITLSSSNVLDPEALLGKYFNILFAGETQTGDKAYKNNAVLVTSDELTTGAKENKVDYVKSNTVDLNNPETQWGVVAVSGNTMTLQNRESGATLTNVSFRMSGSKYVISTSATSVTGDVVTLKEHAITGTRHMDGFMVETPNALRNKVFNIGQYHNETGNVTAYWAENHQSNASHQLGVITEKADAAKWTLRIDMLNDKDAKETATIDTVYVITKLAGKKDGKIVDELNADTLAILPYQIQNKENLEYVFKNTDGRTNFLQCQENESVETLATRFALKKKVGNTYNVVLLAAAQNEKHATGLETEKIYVANSVQWGSLKPMHLYADDNNSLMVVEPADDPEYHLVNGDKLAWGDTIKLFRDENNNQALYEKRDNKSIVANDTLSFLNIDNVYDPQFKMNPALFVDTAYVNRGENTCWQYLLAVNVDNSVKTWCPDDIKHNDPEWIKEHGVCPHAEKTPVVKGRFLVNLIDTANIYGATHLHKNPYVNQNEAGEYRAKLSFVPGMHIKDTLFLFTNDDTIKLNLSTPDFNIAKFAFRYEEAKDETFKIQTLWKEYAPEDAEKDREKSQEGYLKWINGTVVVENGYNRGDLFGIEENFKGNPTANETIEAVSGIQVIAGEGQVTIAGAAGKKVVISNILGQVVANTVIASDNATIAAPAGVVVVAVEGEAAVKAIVK